MRLWNVKSFMGLISLTEFAGDAEKDLIEKWYHAVFITGDIFNI